ncbi:hypothetical protein RND81_05G001200 [Saponaria officinalis]|uniref:HhH-GPD domain-containing protein n=2 Tax=Saponaria officinalis TaxID=3572 RepID=A0AAW1KT34_SAPOF
MEETVRKKLKNQGMSNQILRVCEYRGLVQIAGQRDKACINPVIVLALASPSNSPILTSRPCYSKFAKKHTNDGCRDVARLVSPYFSNSTIIDMNVGSNNCDVSHVTSPYFSKKEDNFMSTDGGVGDNQKSKRAKRGKKNGGVCCVLGSRDGRGNEETCHGKHHDVDDDSGNVEEQHHVRETNLARGLSLVKHEDLRIEKDVGALTKSVLLKGKGKRSKQRRENARTGVVVDVDLSHVKKGKDGTGYEIEIGDGSLCTGMEEKLENFVEANIIPGDEFKCKKRKRRRENMGTGDIFPAREVETRTEKGEHHVGDYYGEGQFSRVLFKETHEDAVKVKDVDVTRNNLLLKSKRSHRSGQDVVNGEVEGGKINEVKKRKLKICYRVEKGEEHVEERNTPIGMPLVEHKDKCKNLGKQKQRGRKIGSDMTCNDGSRVVSSHFLKMDNDNGGIIMEEERNKKRRVHNECCLEGKTQNKKSGMGSHDQILSNVKIEVENETEPTESPVKVNAESATNGFHKVFCQRDYAAEIHVKGKCSTSDTENNFESSTKSREATSPCSRNVRRKRVMYRKLDKISPGDEEKDTVKIPMTKHKKILSFSKLLLDAEQEDVLESSAIECRKEDCIHNNLSRPQASTTLSRSPYFDELLLNGEREDERNELDCKIISKRKIDKGVVEAFDQLLSKYAYKSDTINDVGDNVDNDETNDGVSGKLERKKKQRRGISNTNLTRAEKFAEAYRRKDPSNTWKPPSSPYELLQEDHAHDPWRVLVICMLLNITTGPQVKKVLSLFFRRWPNAEAAASANEIEISVVIASLGLHWKRSAMIRRFSSEYLSDDWTHVTQLHGIGKYAADAYAIFCNGMWDQVTPTDHMLKYYWKFLHKHRGFWKPRTA